MRVLGLKVLKNRLRDYVQRAVETVRWPWLRPLLPGREEPPIAPVAPLATLLAELDRDRGDR